MPGLQGVRRRQSRFGVDRVVVYPHLGGDGLRPPVRTPIPGEVFRDILHSSLADSCSLPESDSSDIVTCICVADVGMAGRQSLVLGTYGHQILCYDHTEAEAAWSLAWRRSLSAPVLSVRCEDLTGDGVRELIVVTARGVQVLQLQLDNVKEVAIQRLRKLVEHKTALESSNS